jgi:endoglucanase
MKAQLLVWSLLFTALLAGCDSKKNMIEWSINDQEYIETQGFNVLVFHNSYPVGYQGGIELIHHGDRIGTNGYLTVDLPGSAVFPRPETATRTVESGRKEVRAVVNTPGYDLDYRVRLWPENDVIHLAVDLVKPIPAEWKDRVSFDLWLYPGAYEGKTWHLGDKSGLVPVEGLDPMERGPGGEYGPTPLASGSRLLLAPEDPLVKLQIERENGELSLVDNRNTTLGGWLIVRSVIPEGVDTGAVKWTIRPNLVSGWHRKPVVTLSQVGYHPAQVKQAVIELDARTGVYDNAVLRRFEANGSMKEVKSGVPAGWGKFLRYKYAIFDFSEVREPGMYTLSYGDQTTKPFAIGRDVYQRRVWQPTLEIYFPVQMCHMRVRDRVRVWHGACHLDDAVQAPVSTEHVDGYRTYETTETRFKPFESVPGLNRGGWHDAGDNDLAAGSQAQTVLFLALAGEAFGIDVDQTTVDQDALFVQIRRPDGLPDLQQQLEHGVINLLSGYRLSGHSFVGIIETREGRAFLGDVASVTDQLRYDRSLKPDEVRGNRSGAPDDRWVVTNKDTSLEYQVITALAAASRLLRGYNDDLAEECLATAIRAWQHEQDHEPVLQPNAYVPGHPGWQEVHATAELLITTGEERFRKRMIELLPVILEAPQEVGWTAARALNAIGDDAFSAQLAEALAKYRQQLDESLAGNPYGVPWRPRIWGIGWDIQEYAVTQYYLHRAFPELFGRENLCRVVNYVLGCHPGSSTTFVSAVGAESLIPAYGFNMHWWSYIPGGNAAGTALVRPDYPELKVPYPYIWQQTEYVMPGASTYIFCILAADKLLNES